MKSRTAVVARREFVSTIKRKGWLIATFGMPFFLLLYVAIASLAGFLISKEAAKPGGTIGIVDLAGFVKLPEGGEVKPSLPPEAAGAAEEFGIHLETLPSAGGLGARFRLYPDEAAGRAALDAEKVKALYVIPADYLTTGKATVWDASGSFLSDKLTGESAMRGLLVRSLLADHVDPALIDRTLAPLSTEVWSKNREGEWSRRSLATILASIGVPIAFSLLLMLSLMINAGQLLEGVSEEKENRVIEVLLSSIDAQSLLAGKLLGLGAAGLLQLTIWLLMAVVPAVSLVAGAALRPGLVAVCLAAFLLGFTLFGTLITATGALGTNAREAQQFGMIWSLGAAIPWMFFALFLTSPDGMPARILSYVPLTAPVSIMMRTALGHVAWWEYLLSGALLVGAIVVALRMSGRMFRTALLMYGKRPTVPEIWRWLRQSS